MSAPHLNFRYPLYTVLQSSVFLIATPAIFKVHFYLIIVILVVGAVETFFDVLCKPRSQYTLYTQVQHCTCHSGSSIYSFPFSRSRALLSVSFSYSGFSPVTCGRQFLLPFPWSLRLSFHKKSRTVGSNYVTEPFPQWLSFPPPIPKRKLFQDSTQFILSASSGQYKSPEHG